MSSILIRMIVVFVLFAGGIAIGYNILYKEEPLKIYTPADLNKDIVDESLQFSDEPHFIGDFKLMNQDSNWITPETYKDQVYVASFIFTTCPGICPIMTKKKAEVFQEFYNNQSVSFLSHTVDPETDSVPVLKEFSRKFYATAPQWSFVTGSKKEIYDLARKHYFAATSSGDGGPDDFVHTENFVLIDKEKRIRGFYDGTLDEDIEQLTKDIYKLLRSYE